MDYICRYCSLIFNTEELRDKHHAQCGPSLLIKIQLDQAIKNLFTAKLALRRAQKNVKEKKKHHCTECSYRTDRKSALDCHKLVHSKEGARIFKCTTCNFGTPRKSSFGRHLKIHSQNIKSFDCYICDYTTKRKDVLKQHMLVHDRSDKKMFSCEICDYKSVYKSSMNSHSLVHDKSNKPQYICYHCSLKTHDKGTLKRHLLQKHSKRSKPIKCPSCKREFSFKPGMENHILRVHPQLSHVVTSKVHSCTNCSYKTTMFGNLRSHQITHSKQAAQAFKCNICDYIGYRKGYLNKHMLIHEGIKQYECAECNKQFTQDCHLAGHILSNHGTNEKLVKTITRKIYTCEHCKYRNITKGVMETHYKVMHNKKYA